MRWWPAAREVLRYEWLLLRRFPRLRWAFVGLLFVPALYAAIYLRSMWDPASHTHDLPAGLVNLDTGAEYRGRALNLGQDVLAAIETHAAFAWRRFDDAETARREVRQGRLAFVLEIPADFSSRALPGEQPGAAKFSIYTSEGNNYSSAGFARRFAPDLAQRLNTLLGETRWDLVLSSAAGSRRSLDSLREALAGLHRGAGELATGLAKARAGGAALADSVAQAEVAAQDMRSGAHALADGAQQLVAGIKPLGPALRAVDARRPADTDLAALRGAAQSLVEGQRDLGVGLDQLGTGARQLGRGLAQLKEAAEDLPLFGGRLSEGIDALQDGAKHLGGGIDTARAGSTQLRQGARRVRDGVAQLAEGNTRAGAALGAVSVRLPEDARLDSFADGARELARGSDGVLAGARQFGGPARALHSGISGLAGGAVTLRAGIELLRGSLPGAVDAPGGSAQGLAMAVEPVIEVVAPVPNNGSALTPNFVPLALWVGAVMAAFLVHLRRIVQPLEALPRSAQVAGKLALPAAVVVLQAALMMAMLVFVLEVPVAQPLQFALTLATASLSFLALVFALIRLFGDLGKVIALLLLVVQVSAAGALLPIELSDQAFQALHPYLPLTWVVQAFRASLFGAFEGAFWPAWSVVAAIGVVALGAGTLGGRWRPVTQAQWQPPLDIE